ncbi:hypothetical protein KEJ23_03375 [Candidatus Bathyarchaeota archaeon]|nr:hypothetical protein [Candidatus Bathyarchaeota archaeon]
MSSIILAIALSILVLSAILIPTYPSKPRRLRMVAKNHSKDPVKTALREFKFRKVGELWSRQPSEK